MSEARLVMSQGPQPGQTFTIGSDKELTTLGRDPGNDIVIGDPQVSRQHARIVQREGMLVLEDVGSTNGTFVNGVRLTGPHALSDGDVINLGDTVTLTFYGAAPAVTVPLGSGEPVAAAPPTYAPPQPPAYTPPPSSPPPPPAFAAEEPAAKSKKAWWIGCGCLAVLLVCVAVALFLWYAPASFWETLMNWGVPVPTWPF